MIPVFFENVDEPRTAGWAKDSFRRLLGNAKKERNAIGGLLFLRLVDSHLAPYSFIVHKIGIE